MDLEVVGRHALFFDDDSMAAFVNSGDALVDWHSLKIDRYDVRHLLSAPPPPRRRNRSYEPRISDDPSVEFLIDQERYLDLPLETDQTELEEEEKPSSSGAYRSVAFSYENADDSTDQKNTDVGMEASGYLPPFPIPGDIVQSLPPTEKVHQIIARTATFVSKHGGQSEIILRVKQGDNPTFGFLMPDHHLHAYFRYLVEHPELLHTDEKSQDERKTAGTENNPDNVGGALSLLGSIYGSGEDEDGDNGNASPSHNAKNLGSVESATKDESPSRKPILSKTDKIPAVKKNSSIIGSKPKTAKGTKKEDNSSLISAAEEKLKNRDIGAKPKQIPEPPPETKRLIDKLVEFVMRNGKQFEATILEQDKQHERFSFLLPSNQYHPYYTKALQAAQESKVNGKSFYPGQEDQNACGISKKASLKENHNSYSSSELCDVPFESDRKEKFKMVIGKSKKESQETEKESQESGFTVDAAAAAAILQAATKGIKSAGLQIARSTASNSHMNECGRPANLDSLQKTGTTSPGASGGTDSSDAKLTEEQKLKAERLKKAKMFVAMLKSGALPSRTGASRGSSAEPMESGMLKSADEVSRASQERESSLAPASVDKPPAKSDFDEKQSERRLKRKYRSKSIGSEDDEEDSHREGGHSSRKFRSSSRRHGDSGEDDSSEGIHKEERGKDEEVENAVKKDRKHLRRRHRSHSPEESEDGGEKDKHDVDHKHHKAKHWSHHSRHDDREERDKEHRKSRFSKSSRSKSRRHDDTGNPIEKDDRYNGGETTGDERDDDQEDTYKERNNHKRSKRSRHSHRSSSESPERHSSERRKKHRSHHHSRDKHKHRNEHSSSKDRKSRRRHKHDSSSDDENQHRDDENQHRDISEQTKKDELEEGEIKRGTSIDLQQRAPSEAAATEVPDDLRAKIRAMLMATRS